MICDKCKGAGWTLEPDHHPNCQSDKCDSLCPIEVQVRCTYCDGTGKVQECID